MSRLVWPERDGATCRIVVDLKAAAEAGFTPDGNNRLAISLDVYGAITFIAETQTINTGLSLALAFPAKHP